MFFHGLSVSFKRNIIPVVLVFLVLCHTSNIYSADITLSWDDPNDLDMIAGYYVACGTSSGDYQIIQNISDRREFTFTNLQEGEIYYFAVKAYDIYGIESDYSDELVYAVPAGSESGGTGNSAQRSSTAGTNNPGRALVDTLPNQTVFEGSSVFLEASYPGDPGDGSISYIWKQTGGPPVALSDQYSFEPSFVAPPVTGSETLLTFDVEVYDGSTLIANDSTDITINDNEIAGFPENVVTINTSNNKSLGIAAKAGASLVYLSADDTTEFPLDSQPDDLKYGLIDFTVKTDMPGDKAYVVIYLPEPAPDGYKWYKYSPVDGWIDFSEYAEFNADRGQVTLTLVDGGIGDDDMAADGIIIDPSGLGKPPSSEIKTGAAVNSGGGGCFISAASNGSFKEVFEFPLSRFWDHFVLNNSIARIFFLPIFFGIPAFMMFILTRRLIILIYSN